MAAHERGVGARDLGPAPLPPVHEPLLAQQPVRGDHGSAPDAQLPRQRPLGRQARPAEQRARLDRRPQGGGQPRVERSVAVPPAFERQPEIRANSDMIGPVHWIYFAAMSEKDGRG